MTQAIDLPVIDFYYDPISPYAYLAFMQLPQALQGLSYSVRYKPVLFAAMLKTHGQLGPAEIAPKREWTYRQVMWTAKNLGIDMQMPSAHPFNPLPLLRLAVSCSEQMPDGSTTTNRFITQQIFNHVWLGGSDASDNMRLAELRTALIPSIKCDADAAKERLKANTDMALQANLFGVPSLVTDSKIFWGLDSLPMLREYLESKNSNQASWFDTDGGWDTAAKVGPGIKRN